jgi:predicted nucleic acid-binding protein
MIPFPRRPPLYGVDTMLFIYHFENHEQLGPRAEPVLRAAENGECHLVTSLLTLLEILVVPKRLGLTALCQRYRELLDSFPNLSLQPIDREVLEIASDLRAAYNIRTPDSIQLATAIRTRADLFISQDHRLKKIDVIRVCALEEMDL